MTGIHGILLMGTGVIHILYGLLPMAYQKDWYEFYQKKFWNLVTITSDRKMAAFWFVIAGPFMFLTGLILYELEIQGFMPLSVGWVFLTISLTGAIMAPKSGFTIFLLPQALFYLYRA